MKSVRELAEEIVAREGGYVHDPADSGGPTNHGVTLATMQGLRLDVTGDGAVDVSDVRALSRRQAVELFLTRYYQRPGLFRLPQALQPSVFDMYVNAGSMAVTLLQRLLQRRGQVCAPDGVIGPQTLNAVFAEAVNGAQALADAYGMARRDYYYALGDARPASRKYCRRRDGGKGGWILRAEEFISPGFHLTQAQHHARVAAWG